MKKTLFALSLLLISSIGNRALAYKRSATRIKPPAGLVNAFFAELCSKGCSEKKVAQLRKNLRLELHDLNRDSVPEYFIYLNRADVCGAGGGYCVYLVFQKTKSGYSLLAQGVKLSPLPSYTNGYRDLVGNNRSDLSIVPCYSDYASTTYKFDGRKYQRDIIKGDRRKIENCK
jgi:hypothetical protein